MDAQELAAEVDSGARNPTGFAGRLLIGLCIAWSLYQIYIASPLPPLLQEWARAIGLDIQFYMGSVKTRRIHLAFALVLAALAFPLFKSSPRRYIPWYDWVMAAIGVVVTLYAVVFQAAIAERSGVPIAADLWISAIGLVLIMISTYRALGLPLVIVISVFLVYVFFGDKEFVPEVIQWKGASFAKAMWHFWMQEEGVFGKPLEVSTTLIFLFVLFGAILEKAGAGGYFIKVAFALLGHLRGGPAKAAVVASGLSGLYSGSSIANVVTTGTFTIPLMKRTGFTPEKAGAVEVAASTNGQLTPPVMGAAAFLIAEFTGIPYFELIKHAFVPALISYIALVYIVHLEALKLGLEGLPKPDTGRTRLQSLTLFVGGFLGTMILFLVVYYGLGWIKTVFPDMTFTVVVLLGIAAYVALVWKAAQYPDLAADDPDAPITELPRAGEVAVTGLYFILPIILLIWLIMIERLSAGTAAYYAVVAMSAIAFTHHALKSLFRGEGDILGALRRGFDDWVEGLIAGARSMIAIAVATGAAGIIVGTIGLTGAHQVVGAFVEYLSAGSLILMLLLVAVMSLILGMGLPTTANYIVVSSLMAPVIISVGAQNGLLLPAVAAHMFVFYFGILADDTPPVGLAAFAAAAISGGDPIKTGIQGFMYDIRTAILPFLFVFNTELLLIDVGLLKGIFVFVIGVIAMLLFAAATQRYMLVRLRWWEVGALLLVAFTLFRPGFWLDMVQPPFIEHEGARLVQVIEKTGEGKLLRVRIAGPDFNNPDRIRGTTVNVELGAGSDPLDRLAASGLMVTIEGERAILEEPLPGTPFFELSQQFDFYADEPVVVAKVYEPAERMPKEVFYIPALVLLGLVMASQMLRKRRQETMAAAAA
ncbi:MAG TPA: TRAP transporter fused permease subunit [Rhodospirillales bacterium]|nr:TRAP transporter fused permease subunit [Rhodospirillales bacterium]